MLNASTRACISIALKVKWQLITPTLSNKAGRADGQSVKNPVIHGIQQKATTFQRKEKQSTQVQKMYRCSQNPHQGNQGKNLWMSHPRNKWMQAPIPFSISQKPKTVPNKVLMRY